MEIPEMNVVLNSHGTITGVVPFKDGLCSFADRRSCSLVSFPNGPYGELQYGDREGKVKKIYDGIYMLTSGTTRYCNLMEGGVVAQIRLLENEGKTVDILTIERILKNGVAGYIQRQMEDEVRFSGDLEHAAAGIFIGGPSHQEKRCFEIEVSRSSCTFTWLKSNSERKADERRGRLLNKLSPLLKCVLFPAHSVRPLFNRICSLLRAHKLRPLLNRVGYLLGAHKLRFWVCNLFPAPKLRYLVGGSGAYSAANSFAASLTSDCSQTLQQIHGKIMVAANSAMLETSTCGGSLDVLTFLHEDAAAPPTPSICPPIVIQQGDKESFRRVLLLRVSIFLSDTPFVYRNRVIQQVQRRFGWPENPGEVGILRINYFFSTNRYRFWRIVTDGPAEDLLNKIVVKLGLRRVEDERNFFPIGGLHDGDEIAVARCQALNHECPCFKNVSYY